MFIIHLLVLVLNEVELLDPILEGFMEIGISGATIIDTTGMGRTLAYSEDIPIFGGLRKAFENCHPSNKTVFSVINSDELLQNAIKLVDEKIGDLDSPGAGILFTLPINHVKGLSENNND